MFENSDLAASNFVKGVDTAFIIIYAVSLFFLVAITATMIYFVFRYNNKRNPKATQIKGSTKLEIIWTTIPVLLVIGMFYYGWAGWKPMQKAPKDAFVITTEARMWNFSFTYPNGKREKDLIVPQGKAIKLELKALDVIHSLYIPAFRVKEDLVPGRLKSMWFIPQKLGEYDLFCSSYCGLNHSYMLSTVKVLSDADFQKWYVDTATVAATAGADPAKAGFELLKTNGCFACHSVDGSKLVGPSFKGIIGSNRTVETPSGDKVITGDADYIQRSIQNPNLEIVKGYNKGLMQPYKEILKNDDIQLIIEYLKSISK